MATFLDDDDWVGVLPSVDSSGLPSGRSFGSVDEVDMGSLPE